MKKIKLEILDIEILVDETIDYHDDGFVNSIIKYKSELLKRYGICQNESNVSKTSVGTYGRFKADGRVHHHIAYKNESCNSLNIQTRAHEETHVLDNLERLDLLTDKILEEQGGCIDFELIKYFDNALIEGNEIIAEIGGIYAIQRLGISPQTMEEFRDKNFKIAMDIYKNSKLKTQNELRAFQSD